MKELVSHFTSNSLTETILTVSDRWREFLCPFGREGPDQNQNQNCLLVIRPRTIIHQM